jgi:hypothetical protein
VLLVGCFASFFNIHSGVRRSQLGTEASGVLYQPQMTDDDDCGEIGERRIGRGNRSTLRKPAPVPLCPPQIPHDLPPGSNPGHCGGKPATSRLSYGTALGLAYSSTLKMKAVRSYETSVNFYWSTRLHISQDVITVRHSNRTKTV